MRINTMITLGASAAFGIMAVFLARGWINGAVENEFRVTGHNADTAPVIAAQTRPVLVANIDLQFGDVLSPDNIKTVNYPLDAVPFDSFETADDILAYDLEQNIIALTSIARNEPIMPRKISGPNGKASLSSRITQGYRAASIRVNAVTGVSGFVVPGDLVDIIYTSQSGHKDKAGHYTSDVILQSVKVLGIDQIQSEEAQGAVLAKTVTLEVANDEAQTLALATKTGDLSLMLRASGETASAPSRPLSSAQLSKPAPRQRAPKQPSRAAKAKAKSHETNIASITIIRGELTESVSVISEPDEAEPNITQYPLNLAGG